jgi:mono/diheme cytochrome c family protein
MRRISLTIIALVIILWITAPLVPGEQQPAGSGPRVDFERDVRPILAENCLGCHGAGLAAGGLKFTDRDAALAPTKQGRPAIIAGEPDASELLRRVRATDPGVRMPMGKDPLAPAAVDTLRRWISEGVVWARHWAFEPVRKVDPPATRAAATARNDIDRFILAKLEEKKINPSPKAEGYTLIRRLHYDLLGLPPSVEDVDAFINDARPDAYERLVDRLLASPHFGERWGRHWLDLARYADSDGYESDRARPDAYVYRDWVIDAVNRDLPFDRFTTEQLAGDLLPDAALRPKIATAFNRQTLTNEEGGTDQEEFRVAAVLDRTATLGTVWLGLTVGCARCHDHKYDPIPQEDHYKLFAFFNEAEEVPAEVPIGGDMPELELKLAPLQKSLAARYAELAPGLFAWQAEEHRSIMAIPSTPLAEEPLEVLEIMSSEGLGKAEKVGSDLLLRAGPERDHYTVTARAKVQEITGFKLWVLPDDALPGKGPGRGPDGKFVLTGFRAYLACEGQADEPIELHRAQADYTEKGFEAEAALSGKGDKSGWSAGDKSGQQHWIQFRTRAPVRLGTGRLRIVLDQQFGEGRAIGRFRLAALTGNERGLHLPRQDVANGLEMYLEKRIARTRRTLLDYYVAEVVRDERVRALRREMADLIKEHGAKTVEVRTIGTPMMSRNTHVLDRGDFLSPRQEVQPGIPRIFGSLPTRTGTADRIDLANWLVSRENPLTARVAVNHVWKLLFGTGLVRTLDDFGLRGERPSHPELLDWLAGQYRSELGWSRKALIRLIVTSATYRQASLYRPELADLDPENRLLARQNRFRVESEIVRDLHLAASGLLVRKIGGPSVFPPMPEDLAKLSYANNFTWKNSEGEDRYRRGMYTFFKRTIPHPNLMTFDSPDANVACVARTVSNTPLQALTLLNNESHVEAAQALARRVLAVRSDDAERLGLALRLCVSRPAKKQEIDSLRGVLEVARQYYATHQDEASKLLAQKIPADVPAPEAAAWVAAVRIILNLDEFITRE